MILVLLAGAMPASASVFSPPYYSGSPGHYYQAVFDGEGEAAVIAKIIQLNTGKEDISKIVLEIPGRVNIRYVFQETQVRANDGYPYYDYPYYGKKYSTPDFAEEQLSWSKKITVNLTNPIKQGDTGSLIIYYKAAGYAKKNVNFDFDFETIKSPFDTPYLRVAVNVDDDLSLRGGETKTTYIQNIATFESLSAPKGVAIAGEQANFIKTISDNVVYAGGYVKTKTNLDPWESFHVTGRYNEKNAWLLNYYEEMAGVAVAIIAINFLIGGGLLGGILGFIRKARKSQLSRIIYSGFLSAAAVSLLVTSMIFLGNSLYTVFRSQIAGTLVVVAGFASILFSVSFPSYYHAQKYGNREGAAVLVSTIVWLVVIAYFISSVFGNGYIYDVAYTMGAAERAN